MDVEFNKTESNTTLKYKRERGHLGRMLLSKLYERRKGNNKR